MIILLAASAITFFVIAIFTITGAGVQLTEVSLQKVSKGRNFFYEISQVHSYVVDLVGAAL